MVLQVFEGVGQLVFLLLLGTVGILRLRREAVEQPEAWRLLRQLWSLWFILVGVIPMLALVVWSQVENIGVFLSGPTHALPSWLSPLAVVAVALFDVGGLLLIPELIWRVLRARRTERR